MLNLKEMPSSSLNWEWGDAISCKKLGALSAGADLVPGLSVQEPDSDSPNHFTEISQDTDIAPFPPSFSEEANFQALSVLKSLEVFCSWAGLKLHIEQSPGKISVCPAKSGWWQLSNSRELHLGAGMEERFHLTNWNLEILQPTYLLLAVNVPFHSRRHIKSALCFPNLPQKYCIWQDHIFCKDWGFGTPLLTSSYARAFEATDFMTISVAHREHLLGALYSPPRLFLCSTLNFLIFFYTRALFKHATVQIAS